MLVSTPPSSISPADILEVLKDPKTSSEQLRTLRELAQAVTENTAKQRELSEQAKKDNKEAQEAKAFSISVATQAKAESDALMAEAKKEVIDKIKETNARQVKLDNQEASLEAREASLKERTLLFDKFHISKTAELSEKEKYLTDESASLKEDKYVVSQLQIALEQKLSKLKEALG